MQLLCTDMDRTLLGNGVEPESVGAMPALSHLIANVPLQLAYVTGRDLARVMAAIDEYALPQPDFIVADVGATVYRRCEEGFEADPRWSHRIGPAWRGLDATGIHECVGADGRLTLQAPDRQSRFKCSYYTARDVDSARLIDDLRRRLLEQRIQASIIFSDDPETGHGLLDLLPAIASKRHSVEYLLETLLLQPAQVLFCGDSGNDLDALCADFPAVLVANARDTVRQTALQASRAAGRPDLLYLARGSLILPSGESLNGNYSAGIVEGLLHFAPSLMSVLPDNTGTQSSLSPDPHNRKRA